MVSAQNNATRPIQLPKTPVATLNYKAKALIHNVVGSQRYLALTIHFFLIGTLFAYQFRAEQE